MQPGKEKIIDLLDQAERAQLVLPEFQRSFVWSRKDVEELLVSLISGFFIGTLLLLEIDSKNPPFAPRVIEGVQAQITDPHVMVLDGQQRLSSLYYALHELGFPLSNTRRPYRFYLDIGKFLGGDAENSVLSIAVQDGDDDIPSEERQFAEGLLPFIKLASWGEFEDWKEKYRAHLVEAGKFDAGYWEKFRNVAREFLEYQVPFVRLDIHTNLEAVVEVFERINRTGTPLSVFALVTARLYNHGPRLRDLWQETFENGTCIQFFSEKDDEAIPRIILQVVSLLRGKECKKKDLISIEHDNFNQDWNQAAAYVEKALDRLKTLNQSGYGVMSKDWLPYSTICAPLAALLWVAEKRFPGQSQVYERLHKWYWSSVFTERYAGASDTAIHSDFIQVSRWFANPGEVPEAVQKAAQLIGGLDLTRSRKSAVYKGIMCLIALNGALDFRTGDSIQLHELDDHHVFPKRVLTPRYDAESVNVILNRTLISSATNRILIRDRRPSQYLDDMEREMGVERMSRVLQSHFIDNDSLRCMRNDDYDGFIEHRRTAFMSEIRRRIVV